MPDLFKRLMLDPFTTATSLCAIVIDKWDTEAFYWEPEILEEELAALAGEDLPQINIDKIYALVSAISSESFYIDFYSFNHICNALGGSDQKVLFNVFDPPTPEEMAWTIVEVIINDPGEGDEDPTTRFHPDVTTYIGILLREAGLSEPPKVLDFVTVPNREDPTELFADEPELLLAYRELTKDNKENVDEYVAQRSNRLLEELKFLKTKLGSADVEAVLGHFGRAEE